MPLKIPSDAAIYEKAVELGFIEHGAEMPPAVRRRTARLITDLEAEAARPPMPPEEQLLSRVHHDVAGGKIRVDVVFIPNESDPAHG